MTPAVEGQTPAAAFAEYRTSSAIDPLFLEGDALEVLAALPDNAVDVVMTSPPYWGQREYAGDGLGLEERPEDYLARLLEVLAEVRRVLTPTGSLWLNIGDRYRDKGLQLLPWRLAIAMTDQQGWVLRNHVVWHKMKGGPDNAKDKLRNVHEPVLHFVTRPRGYHYDVDAIRKQPATARVVDGRTVSATGVSGVRYRRRIELSTELTPREKRAALTALEEILEEVRAGRLADFRMVIRGAQRTTHSDSARVSGRAKELADRGFYFLRYDPRGTKPADVWDILPEATHGRSGHFAAYPEELCRIPLLATCPEGGIVLDPFCGTGTTNLAALDLGRKSVGIDLVGDYLTTARQRVAARSASAHVAGS